MKTIAGNSWQKLGLVYDASKHITDWAKHSALTPTPLLLRNGLVRVFAGFRDDAGVSRIGYADIDPARPQEVVNVSKRPALDTGRPGCFDDNGVILGDVVRHAGKLYMFYVGFQMVAQVKFLAFTGLAISEDEGEHFQRISEAPILDRHEGELYFAAVHSAHFENGRWRLWCGAGDAWLTINGTPYPSYGVHYVETADLLNIPAKRTVCLAPSDVEYRIGRPRVYRTGEGYLMQFTAGTTAGSYLPGQAHSRDGIEWVRDGKVFDIGLSAQGWDSKHLSYTAMLALPDRVLMFYNGNAMGRDGFGVAMNQNEEVVNLLLASTH